MSDSTIQKPLNGYALFATDEVTASKKHYPIHKLAWGDFGTYNLISSSSPLPVSASPGGLAVASQYHIKRANITTASVNLAFGFTSVKVLIWADAANTDDIAVDFTGGTAVAPAANTAGHYLLSPGEFRDLDIAIASLSVIAASGTQTVKVSALA